MIMGDEVPRLKMLNGPERPRSYRSYTSKRRTGPSQCRTTVFRSLVILAKFVMLAKIMSGLSRDLGKIVQPPGKKFFYWLNIVTQKFICYTKIVTLAGTINLAKITKDRKRPRDRQSVPGLASLRTETDRTDR